MSVWAEVCGKIRVPKDAHVSIRTLIKEHFDEVVIAEIDQKVFQTDYFLYTVEFSFCGSGNDAFKRVSAFHKIMKEAKWLVDISCTLRF